MLEIGMIPCITCLHCWKQDQNLPTQGWKSFQKTGRHRINGDTTTGCRVSRGKCLRPVSSSGDRDRNTSWWGWPWTTWCKMDLSDYIAKKHIIDMDIWIFLDDFLHIRWLNPGITSVIEKLVCLKYSQIMTSWPISHQPCPEASRCVSLPRKSPTFCLPGKGQGLPSLGSTPLRPTKLGFTGLNSKIRRQKQLDQLSSWSINFKCCKPPTKNCQFDTTHLLFAHNDLYPGEIFSAILGLFDLGIVSTFKGIHIPGPHWRHFSQKMPLLRRISRLLWYEKKAPIFFNFTLILWFWGLNRWRNCWKPPRIRFKVTLEEHQSTRHYFHGIPFLIL